MFYIGPVDASQHFINFHPEEMFFTVRMTDIFMQAGKVFEIGYEL
jgi:hypothetical protein